MTKGKSLEVLAYINCKYILTNEGEFTQDFVGEDGQESILVDECGDTRYKVLDEMWDEDGEAPLEFIVVDVNYSGLEY